MNNTTKGETHIPIHQIDTSKKKMIHNTIKGETHIYNPSNGYYKSQRIRNTVKERIHIYNPSNDTTRVKGFTIQSKEPYTFTTHQMIPQ